MSGTLLYDKERFYFEPSTGMGDNLTASAHSERGDIHLRIEEPWAGDTESGFGAICGITLSRGQAKVLATWILERCKASRSGDESR